MVSGWLLFERLDISSRNTRSVRMRTNRTRTVTGSIAGMIIAMFVISVVRSAYATSTTLLEEKVTAALRADRRLNGAKCYCATPGVIILTGKVFDDQSRTLAEVTAYRVPGVKQVVNTLLTDTGQWQAEEAK